MQTGVKTTFLFDYLGRGGKFPGVKRSCLGHAGFVLLLSFLPLPPSHCFCGHFWNSVQLWWFSIVQGGSRSAPHIIEPYYSARQMVVFSFRRENSHREFYQCGRVFLLFSSPFLLLLTFSSNILSKDYSSVTLKVIAANESAEWVLCDHWLRVDHIWFRMWPIFQC